MLLMIGGGWACMVSGLGWGDGGRGRWCCSRYLFETILGFFFLAFVDRYPVQYVLLVVCIEKNKTSCIQFHVPLFLKKSSIPHTLSR